MPNIVDSRERALRVWTNSMKQTIDRLHEQLGDEQYELLCVRIAERIEDALREQEPNHPLLELLDEYRLLGKL